MHRSWPLILIAGALTVSVSAQQRPPVFRSSVDAVRVDVMVTDGARPVRGLSKDDFEVRDNGVVQALDMTTSVDRLSMALAVDVQQESRWEELIRATRVLGGAMTGNDRAWLLTFAETFDLRAGPTSDPIEIQTALENPPTAPGKSLWDTLFAGVSLVAGRDGRALVVVVSDGQENPKKLGWLDEDHAIDLLKRGDVAICAVQPRSVVSSPTALERAARATGGVVIEAARNARLAEQLSSLLEDFRAGYVLTYTPTGVTRGDGWHRLSVRLRDKPGRVKARDGYYSGIR